MRQGRRWGRGAETGRDRDEGGVEDQRQGRRWGNGDDDDDDYYY